MKAAKKPDLHAPRYRKCASGMLNAAFIEQLREKVPGCNVLNDKEIKEVIKTFNGIVWQTAIDVRDGVELPNQLGHIFIGTCPPKKSKNVDFKLSADFKKVIQHRNWESDNYLAKIFYTTFGSKYRFKHHELWAFNPTRAFKREVGRTYPEYWKRYVMVDPHKKISYVYRDNINAMEQMKQDAITLENYNEFDL
jgi:phage FluMu protein Com